MKQFVPTCLFLLFSTSLFSQDLTGIWRGSFYNIREVMLGGTQYRYEVQIDNSGKGVKGVTYSYQTTRFYGKASLIGMWTAATKNLIMKEEKMEELKIDGGGEGCLMTCYLDYRKDGDREVLEGNYSSRNMNTGADCGGGKVFLERVMDTDFEKEDFLKKNSKKSTSSTKIKPGQEDYLMKGSDSNTSKKVEKENSPAVKKSTPTPAPKKSTPAPVAKKPTTTKPPVAKSTEKPKTGTTTKPPVASSQKPSTKPKTVEPPVTKQASPSKTELEKSDKDISPNVTVKSTPAPSKVNPPPVLKQRKNELFQTIYTSAREISVSFYDNGEIDGDTITVYDNNKLLVQRKGLSAQPITVKIDLSDEDPDHDIVMVAENLGSIPPNTALMMVVAGKQRYTVRLSSNEQNNAMVRFRYQKEEK